MGAPLAPGGGKGARAPLWVDRQAGVAVITGQPVPVRSVGTTGALAVAGTVVRPLAFAERTRLVGEAGTLPDPASAVAAAVARAAAGTDRDEIVTALALHLAGAGDDGPSFIAAVVAVATQLGWGPGDIETTAATEVDRLATLLGAESASEAEDGWQRVVFAVGPSVDATGDDMAALVRSLAEDLLRRSAAPLPAPARPAHPPSDARVPAGSAPPQASAGATAVEEVSASPGSAPVAVGTPPPEVGATHPVQEPPAAAPGSATRGGWRAHAPETLHEPGVADGGAAADRPAAQPSVASVRPFPSSSGHATTELPRRPDGGVPPSWRDASAAPLAPARPTVPAGSLLATPGAAATPRHAMPARPATDRPTQATQEWPDPAPQHLGALSWPQRPDAATPVTVAAFQAAEATLDAIDVDGLATALAVTLDEECDLRGLAR